MHPQNAVSFLIKEDAKNGGTCQRNADEWFN